MHAPVAKLTPTYADQFAGNPSLSMPVQATTPFLMPPPKVENQPLKVALIGTAPSSRMLAPFNDPSWKIWACSPGNMGALPRVDLWFELHGNMYWPECQSYGIPYIKWLKEQTFPLYMQNQNFVERAMTFPMIQMVREFGQDFFTSSFAWMLAFAISQKATEIGLYGIDMASRDEYIIQRQGFYFFRHIATQRGIKVSAPKESDIMQSPGLYGYSEIEAFGRKVMARKSELQGREAHMAQEKAKLEHNQAYLGGAIEDVDYFASIQIGITNEILILSAEVADLKATVAELEKRLGEAESNRKGLELKAAESVALQKRQDEQLINELKANLLVKQTAIETMQSDLARVKEAAFKEKERAVAEAVAQRRGRKKKC